ncbi:hypothetical protein [Sharpea azabuensis]|jgi:hypothetical protein|nr:hypothetical protein [Sharpea azabuensis]
MQEAKLFAYNQIATAAEYTDMNEEDKNAYLNDIWQAAQIKIAIDE